MCPDGKGDGEIEFPAFSVSIWKTSFAPQNGRFSKCRKEEGRDSDAETQKE